MAAAVLEGCRPATLVATLALVLLVSAAGALELPREAYVNMLGKWSVEIATPCSPSFSTGTATITNGSSIMSLASGGADIPLTLPAASEDGALLTLDGLETFLSSQGGHGSSTALYRVCRTQTNYLSTEKRPNYGPRMRSTQFTEMSGALVAKGQQGSAGACTDDGSKSLGDVVLRLVGMPMEGVPAGEAVREAVQYAELMVDTRGLPGACRSAASAEGTERRKTRRRRSGRNTIGAVDVSSEEAESAVASGYVVIRFFKSSPPARSFIERFYPSFIFVALFIIYRVFYGYFSYRASK